LSRIFSDKHGSRKEQNQDNDQLMYNADLTTDYSQQIVKPANRITGCAAKHCYSEHRELQTK